MFEKFGEFNSCEELNAAAAGLLEEGDIDSLKLLARENGISDDDVIDYVEGMVPELANDLTAAYGRIRVQLAHEPRNLQLNVVAMIARSILVDNQELCKAFMLKGKRMIEILRKMEQTAKKHASGTGSNRMSVCCGTDRELEKIIETYYLEPDKLGERLEALYQ